MSQFDHEKLDVYHAAIAFVAVADDVTECIRPKRRNLRDLDRAATSIVLNIAEGAGEFSANDKARFYRIARRSATECAAVLDICRRRNLVTEEVLRGGRGLPSHRCDAHCHGHRHLQGECRKTGLGLGLGLGLDWDRYSRRRGLVARA